MTRNAVAVFGVLRYADELELHGWEIAPRCQLTVGQVRAALRDLAAMGLIARVRHPDGPRYTIRRPGRAPAKRPVRGESHV